MRGHATGITCTHIMPAFDVPVRITMNSSYARLRGKHLAEPVPPGRYRLVADFDASFMKKTLDLAQR
tara:strand:+ start:178 stop:378 length:201 start_codon:yes stop_codon:yes gene_type:complete